MKPCPNCGWKKPGHEDRRTALGKGYITPREKQIIALYAAGSSNSQVCKKLRAGRSTISGLLSKAKDRAQVRTIYQLIALYAASYPANSQDAPRNAGRHL